MSKGALIFAFNNGDFNYLQMADTAAGLVKKHLGIPTTVVTDESSLSQTELQYIDNVILKDVSVGNKRVFRMPGKVVTTAWHNLSRSDAYDLTPYDETIMMDSDYFVMSDRLEHAFGTDHEFLCFDKVYDVTGQDVYHTDKYLGRHSIPMIWATVVYFKKCEFSKLVFDFVKLIKENYRYYAALYNFSSQPFRNDFAFSIALHTLSGYNTDKSHFFPWPMPSLTTQATILDYRSETNEVVYEYRVADKAYEYGVSKQRNMDLHIMNKEDATNSELLSKIKEYIDATS